MPFDRLRVGMMLDAGWEMGEGEEEFSPIFYKTTEKESAIGECFVQSKGWETKKNILTS